MLSPYVQFVNVYPVFSAGVGNVTTYPFSTSVVTSLLPALSTNVTVYVIFSATTFNATFPATFTMYVFPSADVTGVVPFVTDFISYPSSGFIVNTTSFPYFTWAPVTIDELSTFASNVYPSFSSSVNVIVYSLSILSYFAIYVASPATFTNSAFHPTNLYSIPSVDAFVGVSPLYSTFAFHFNCCSSNTVSPSSSTNVIVYILSFCVYVAVYVVFPATATTVLSHFANVYVYSSVDAFVGVSPLYSTFAFHFNCCSSNTVSPSSSTNVIVYILSFCVYVALYVASPVTATTVLSHPANVYVYSSVDAFVGTLPPYTTSSFHFNSCLSNSVPFSSTNIIVYILSFDSYLAVYIASPATFTNSAFHPTNLYSTPSVDAFVGVLPLYSTFTFHFNCCVSNTVSPSSSTNVIVYILSFSINVAVYITSSVTVVIALSHPLNVYVYKFVDACVGLFPLNLGMLP